MTDILDLKGWTVLGRTEEDGADVLEAEYPLPMPTACPKCGTLDCIYRHGTKATTYVDIPMRGKPATRPAARIQGHYAKPDRAGSTNFACRPPSCIIITGHLFPDGVLP